MSVQLSPGANTGVEAGQLTVQVSLVPASIAGIEVDISAFMLGASGKVRSDDDMVFYGQPAPGNGAVSFRGAVGGTSSFSLQLDKVDAAIEKIALTATIHENKASFEVFQQVHLAASLAIGAAVLNFPLATAGMKESALILGEFYRRQGQWKFRAVGQGFIGGLKPLAEYFGVTVEDTQPAAPAAAPPPPPPAPKVSLSKVSLDKRSPTISLEKKPQGFGEIRVNLNWNRGEKPKGFLGSLMGGNRSIDLDLGCFLALADGTKGAVQALGDCFGDFHDRPYIQLAGDDRTGARQDGEWLRINGGHWQDISKVLIFAYIYEGAPNWAATDAVVTVYVPGEPEIEIRLTEGSNNLGMCGVVMLENVGGTIRVSREMRYVEHHEKLDQAFGWGMRWKAGSK